MSYLTPRPDYVEHAKIRERRELLDKLVAEVSLEVGGEHGEYHYVSDDVIILVRAIAERLK